MLEFGPKWRRRRGAIRRKLGIGYRALLAALAAAAVIIKGTTEGKDPVWDNAPVAVTLGVVVVLAVAALRDNLKAVKERVGEVNRNQRTADQQKQLVLAAVTIAEITGLPVDRFGGSVFKVRSGTILRWKQHLNRVNRFRLSDHPQPSDVNWTPGKGVIGVAWRQERWRHCHWAPIARRWGHLEELTEPQWARIPVKTRWGFSRGEFLTMVLKYAEVLAVPIKDKYGQVLGVVSIDLSFDPDEPSSRGPVLNQRRVVEVVTTAAELLRDSIGAR